MIYPMPQGLDPFEEHEVLKRNKKGLPTPEQLALLAQYETVQFNFPKVDTTTQCVYVGKNEESYLLDAGFKDYVRVPKRPSEAKYLDKMEMGQKTEVYIDVYEENPFTIEGSISSLKESQAHKILMDKKEPVEGLVRELIPAGYMVDINVNGVEMAGFLPNTHADVNRLSDPESILNQKLMFLVESFSNDEGTYILSRRNYLLTLVPAAIKKLKFNTVYTGVVTGTTQFGIFVQFEDILTGMIHKSMVREDYQERLAEIPAGTEIQFYIKDIFKEGKNTKLVLTQILKPTLWDDLLPNDEFQGTIKSVRDFGVLVALDDETNGLITTLEMSRKKVTYEVGDKVNVRVTNVDRANRKIQLNIIR